MYISLTNTNEHNILFLKNHFLHGLIRLIIINLLRLHGPMTGLLHYDYVFD